MFKSGLSTDEGLKIWDIMREVGGMGRQRYVDAFRQCRGFYSRFFSRMGGRQHGRAREVQNAGLKHR